METKYFEEQNVMGETVQKCVITIDEELRKAYLVGYNDAKTGKDPLWFDKASEAAPI